MGKKKRYIHRVKKFGKKMFNFLDRLDGNLDDIITDSTGKVDDIIDEVFVTDRGDQTIKLDARALGTNFTGKNITYTVNSLPAATVAVTVGAAGSGRDKFRFPSAEPAVDGTPAAIVLDAGDHTVTAQVIGQSAETNTVTKKFRINRSVISMTPNANFLTVNGDNINMDLREITVVGTRPGELGTPYAPGATEADNGHSFKISGTIKTGDDAAALAEASHAAVDLKASLGGQESENHNSNAITDLLNSNIPVGKHVEVKITLTARTAANVDLPDTMTDTITFVSS